MDNKNKEVYSKVVRAGKRTYFFDVKATKGNDLYLTLTESKKTIHDGCENFEKHKLFLYKEDFEKFQQGLQHVIDKIEVLKSSDYTANMIESVENRTDISFDEL
jgi:hypothetical protein